MDKRTDEKHTDLKNVFILSEFLSEMNISEEELHSKGIDSISLITEKSMNPKLVLKMKNDERIIIDGESGIVDYLKNINNLNFS